MFHIFFFFFDKTEQSLCGTSARCSWLLSSTSCSQKKRSRRKRTRREKFRFVEIWYGCLQHGPRLHTASIFFGESISFSFGCCCRHRWRFPALAYIQLHTFRWQTKRIVISRLAFPSSAWLCSFADAENKRQQCRKYSMWWFLCHASTHNSYNIIFNFMILNQNNT